MRVGAVVAAAILIGSCGLPIGIDDGSSPSPGQPAGGILRLAIPHDDPPPSALASSDPTLSLNALDPHFAGWYDALELHRCCLSRTLLSYVGRPTEDGGTVLMPDLAESLPEVSSDGLTWTFRIRRGIRYAPPLEDVEVTAPDFVRALLRVLPVHAQFGGFATLNQLGIMGVPEFLAGQASTVSGFEIPDPYTLRIRLAAPAGDLPARFATADTTPIPPNPADPAAPLGVATGHDEDYGRFAVATGPYMIEGSERLDFSLPPAEQVPVAGFAPSRSVTLVRNPSWQPATDALRPAYVDRIEISIGDTLETVSQRVDDGQLDFVFSSGSPPQAPPDQIERYRADPALGQVHPNSRDIIRYIEMNLALPPLDDVHVRKAINLALDKALLLDGAGGPLAGKIAGHLVLDSLENNLLLAYDPYGTPGGHGDPTRAQAEMRLSKYDRDGDGRCDDPACSSVGMVTFRLAPEQTDIIVANLAALGITTRIEGAFPPVENDVVGWFHDPAKRIGLLAGGPWAKDSLNAGHYFKPVFDSRWSMSDEATNGNMVGASRERLERWGYAPVDLPTVDDRIDACLAHVDGTTQIQCWANLDQYLMEAVVPWVPLFFESYTRTVSNRVVHYSFDQLAALPALDQIALTPGG
jgi:peptide/nickel transport system substrate-binding protein